jgi:hypothetical protein
MGLYVHTLGEIPLGATRKYYIYLLDYGWDEPLSKAVYKNLAQMADRASRTNAAVIHGPRGGVHFADEVLSWHRINGQPADEILPALLITTRHPKTIRESGDETRKAPEDSLLLIPLKKVAKNGTEVVAVINQVFNDIRDEKRLKNFAVAQEMHRGAKKAIVDAVVLQPRIGGFGFDLKKFFSELRNK